MKHLLTSIALLSCTIFTIAQEAAHFVAVDGTPAAQTQTADQRTFGYFSYTQVMQVMPEYAIAQKSINDLKATYDQELERAERDFSQKYTEFLEGQKTFPENIMLKRQKELQMLMNQSIQFKQEAKELLAKAEKELLDPIDIRLQAAVQSVGFENNLLYILNTDSNAYPYISNDAIDCTQLILKKLGIATTASEQQ